VEVSTPNSSEGSEREGERNITNWLLARLFLTADYFANNLLLLHPFRRFSLDVVVPTISGHPLTTQNHKKYV